MKYKIKGTDILYNGKVYAEGKTIELNEKDASAIADYLDLIPKEDNEAKRGRPPKETGDKEIKENNSDDDGGND